MFKNYGAPSYILAFAVHISVLVYASNSEFILRRRELFEPSSQAELPMFADKFASFHDRRKASPTGGTLESREPNI